MIVKSHIKYVRISPIKLRNVADDIKKIGPALALDRLSLTQSRVAHVMYKAIKSAVDNGKQQTGFDVNKATFKVLKIDGGPVLKRFRAGPRGIARPYIRKSSHITVVLEQKVDEKGSKNKATSKSSKASEGKEASKGKKTNKEEKQVINKEKK